MCVLVCVVMMPQRKYYDVPYPNILLEIEKSTKEYMTTQFEHNKYFTEELKEHSAVLHHPFLFGGNNDVGSSDIKRNF